MFLQFVKRALPATLRHRLRFFRYSALHKGEPEIRLIPDLIRGGDIAVDVGAHAGMYAHALSLYAETVLVFEPNPYLAKNLRHVLRPNCEIMEAALSEAEGMSLLRTPITQDGEVVELATLSVDNDFHFAGDVHEVTTRTVVQHSLDNVLGASRYDGRHVSFIKIDVEGYELSVIKGALGIIERDKPTLLIEMEYCHNSPVIQIFVLLDDIGYDAQVLVRGELIPINAAALKGYQRPDVLRDKLLGRKRDGSEYINNVIFSPKT
jgi:FkbM family methyltransferase